jgi:hypothetical protein
MKYKSDLFNCFKIFRALFEKSKTHIIHALQTNNGGKYLSFRIGDGAISWKSRKQAKVSLSSTEGKCKSLSEGCKEGLWSRHLLTELQLRPDTAFPLHIDNEGAEALAKNPKHHARTKHIHAQYHFIREFVQDQEVSLLHVSTHNMVVDMLTKPLLRLLLEKNRDCFGLV